MNILFTLVFLICTFLLLCTSPDTFLSALLEGAGKGATVSVSLIATYCVRLGLMRVWEDSGAARGISMRQIESRLSARQEAAGSLLRRIKKEEATQCFLSFGPSDWIRTSGLLNPIQARYQTSPHPEISAVP